MSIQSLTETKNENYVWFSDNYHMDGCAIIAVGELRVHASTRVVRLFGQLEVGKVANFGETALAVYLAKTDEERINAVVTRITQEGE